MTKDFISRYPSSPLCFSALAGVDSSYPLPLRPGFPAVVEGGAAGPGEKSDRPGVTGLLRQAAGGEAAGPAGISDRPEPKTGL